MTPTSNPDYRDLDRNPRPDAPDPNCKHSIKTMYPNVRTVSGVAVYQCHECGRIVTALGVIVLNAKEISP